MRKGIAVHMYVSFCPKPDIHIFISLKINLAHLGNNIISPHLQDRCSDIHFELNCFACRTVQNLIHP